MAKEDIVKYQFTSDQSRTKAAQNGRKGGVKSGEAKREKKLFRDLFIEMLDDTEIDLGDGLVTTRKAVVKKAVKFLTDPEAELDARDYIKVMEFIRDTVGEKPTDKVELSVDDESAREIDEYFAAKNNRASGK